MMNIFKTFLLSPNEYFESEGFGLQKTAKVILLIGLTRQLPTILVGRIEGLGIFGSILFWAVLGTFAVFILWAVLSLYVYGFIRKQSSYGIGRVASFVGITAIPWAIMSVIETVIIILLMIEGAPASASDLTTQLGFTIPILMTVAVIWQARLLLPAVRVGGGVNHDRARGTVTIFTILALSLLWATYLM